MRTSDGISGTLATTGPDDKAREAINSIGSRADREYAETPPAGVLRLACFGDSFTHGSEVSTEDTWAYQLEQRDSRLEVLNFGVGGYGTDQALLRFRHAGLRGAQVALIGLMPENIGRNVNRYRPLWYPATQGCVAKPRFVMTDRGLESVPSPLPDEERAGRGRRDRLGDRRFGGARVLGSRDTPRVDTPIRTRASRGSLLRIWSA